LFLNPVVARNARVRGDFRVTMRAVKWALAALGLLMVPLVASQVVDGWNWGPGAFIFAYVMFFGTG